jgi:hypothetical protein
MVKARGYELLSDPQLKLGVDLRGFGLTMGFWNSNRDFCLTQKNRNQAAVIDPETLK